MTDRYTLITADSHAGGSHAEYREYLDPAFLDDFDDWRGTYRNPFKDLKDDRRSRNWDSAQRWSEQESDGVVAEVLFPNTVPPFFPSFVLFAAPPKPDEYVHRLAGIRAHNRWLVDFVAECPERRAGIGQIFLNDVDDAITDAQFVIDHDLRGGVLLPNIGPELGYVKPLYDPGYDPLWRLLEEHQVPVNIHGGTGVPDYGTYEFSMLLYINEVRFFSQRPLTHLILGGVLERFPGLRVVVTEAGCDWVPELLANMDSVIRQIRDTGATGEIRYTEGSKLRRDATEYFRQNVWMGVSQPDLADIAALDAVGRDRFMWGNDYPHDEGTYPFTREHIRQVLAGVPEQDIRAILGGNAAELYRFDLDALAPLAAQHGPTVEELNEPLTALPENANDALRRGLQPA